MSNEAFKSTVDSTGEAHTIKYLNQADDIPMSNDGEQRIIDDSEDKPESAPGKSPLFILLIMVGMVTAGSLCTIIGKIMDQ